MKVSFPHMGHTWVGIHALFNELKIDYIMPPFISQRTLSLGVQHSPSGLCIPFKYTMGNFIEALDMGADTLLQAGGAGICRLGRYALSQEQALGEMGYNFRMVKLGVSEKKLQSTLAMFRSVSNNAPWLKTWSALRFGVSKISALDDLERVVHKIRPREIEKGTATRIFRQATEHMDKASDYSGIKATEKEFMEKLHSIPLTPDVDPLIVGIAGEFYVVLEPFSNLDIEIELGKLGVEVRRKLFVSEWTKFSWYLNPFGISEDEKLHQAASPYLTRDVGGEGWETVGEKVLHSKDYDGLVHLLPFTCMPEIIAQNIMPSTKEELPVLSIICDEQMGKAGLQTRLEAFADLLRRRRNKKRQASSRLVYH
ncbi:MAG: CoA protein activase [Dehalococcoidia bacterium]|nr:CoA protein activase [Dehalococcoidia bacterium]MBF8304592.1 CoA protein activase [Dehalococcoidia bacterium]